MEKQIKKQSSAFEAVMWFIYIALLGLYLTLGPTPVI